MGEGPTRPNPKGIGTVSHDVRKNLGIYKIMRRIAPDVANNPEHPEREELGRIATREYEAERLGGTGTMVEKAVCRCPCTCGHSHGKASGGTCQWCKFQKTRTPEAQRKTKLTVLVDLVNEQAKDEGLWAIDMGSSTQNIVEAYLQQELRKLHAAVEEYLETV